ncbi:MAG: hypothetical protein PHG14_15700 [Desulfobacter postgatei]|uniref:hypothetical protein n=1 Tax=Desulfobacter postgatei TaxID=2293 RepID=UPI0023F511B8|nr:hypothetical protein [Desulfobacter postgatei]MDD4275160.1 hypothetical protein [Desulfobacter postgatei]
MENLIIENWKEMIAINIEGRDIDTEMHDWMDEKGSLVLIEDGIDFRDSFVREWGGLMTDEFCDKYLA